MQTWSKHWSDLRVTCKRRVLRGAAGFSCFDAAEDGWAIHESSAIRIGVRRAGEHGNGWQKSTVWQRRWETTGRRQCVQNGREGLMMRSDGWTRRARRANLGTSRGRAAHAEGLVEPASEATAFAILTAHTRKLICEIAAR